MGGGYISQYTGPLEYATETRLSTFWTVGHLGMQHNLFFSSSAPNHVRIHLREVDPTEALLLSVYWGVPNRVNAYIRRRRVIPYAEPLFDTCSKQNGGVSKCCPPLSLDMSHGTNIYDRIG